VDRVISSRDNPKLKLVRRLQSASQRRRLGLFVAEGQDLVTAAREAGVEPVELLVAGETVGPELLAEVATLPHPPRELAVFRVDDLPPLEPRPVGLALWHVSDPGNVGTLIRSADAFGAFVALSRGCGEPTGPKALRASAGAVFRVPLGRFDDAPGRRLALVAHGGRPLDEVELAGGDVFVLGAEREGLPEDVLAACGEQVTIPTPGPAESLNVAAAGAIALWEWHRRSAAPDRSASST
jgi:TrmH family RNA methyltransferase